MKVETNAAGASEPVPASPVEHDAVHTDDRPCPSGAQNWKLTLAYDGTGFAGWQVQPGLTTIQGMLADALLRITGEAVLPQGSGRTDAGVHALGQTASFALRAPVPPANLQRALNRALPPAIRVLSAEHAAPGFHARHDATSKAYEYRIFRGDICPPLLARYVYPLNWPLDMEAMQQAAAAVLGEHDFASFAAADPDRIQRAREALPLPEEPLASLSKLGTVRTLTRSAWQQEEEMLTYAVSGNGFLHHMVRNLAGTMLEIGRGLRPASAMNEILAARSRSAAGATAPARGLFLMEVRY